MRWKVWCSTLVLLACGQSKARLDGQPSGKAGNGGTHAAGDAGAMSAARGGEEAGAGTTAGGGSSASASGGAPPNGGTGSTPNTGGFGAGGSGSDSSGAGGGGLGVAGDASGGMASAGEGGGGEAGGPVDACATYDACGCGCCGGLTPKTACYYPDSGQDLARIVADDQAMASDPGCANAGCSSGTRHVCCAVPEPTAAAYEASYYIGGLNHLTIERTGSDGRCALLELVAPDSSPVPYSLEIPEGWAIQGGRASPCDGDGKVSSPWLFAFGGIGSVSFSTPEMCAVDFDFTLFFESDSGTPEPERFQAEGLSIGGFHMTGCP